MRSSKNKKAEGLESENPGQNEATLNMASRIASAYVSNNQVPVGDIRALLSGIYGALANIGGDVGAAAARPAVPVKHSVTADYIICLEDGKKLRTLKRYLGTHYDMTPEQYRAKWNLPRDYPMVAPSYAKLRSEFAKKSGLGRVPSGSKRAAKRKAD